MRRTATVLSLLTAATLVAGLQVTSAAAAPRQVAAAPKPGTYVALAKAVRVLDTRTGANGNHKGAVAAGRAITAKVVGKGGVPTAVGSVVVTLSALSPTGSGGLTAWGPREPKTTNLQFAKGDRAVSDTAVVPVSSGRISIRNVSSAGRVQVTADVTGYYTAGTPSSTEPGVYRSLATSARVFDTRTAGKKKPLAAGAVTSLALGGRAGVPAEANAVAATVTVVSPTRAGTIATWRAGDATSGFAALHFAAGQRVSGFTVLGLGGGAVNLRNTAKGTVHVIVDVTGYYVGNVSQTAGTLRPVQEARVLSGSLRAGADLPVTVAGKGGVPLTNVSAVVVTVHAITPKADGSLQAWRSGTARPAGTVAFYFDKGVTTSNTILAPVANGRIALHNTAKGTVGLAVDVHGYVPSNTITAPKAFVGRYPNALIGETHYDQSVLQDAGTADGAAGSSFVLLDLGAQSTKAPVLTPAAPGVVLALTGDKRVAIPYGDLVTDLTVYLQAYSEASSGRPATIAVGTNNDGVFDPADPDYYSPANRGKDFADLVIDPLQAAAPANITVLGANDIESGFASDQYQATEWENAYLAATTGDLIYNGSLDGCGSTFGSTAACAYGWTLAQYVKLTTNQGRVRVLPQIYVRNQSVQWANLDKASKGTIRYAGVLTESLDADTFTAPQGWVAFVRALASVRTTVPAKLPLVDIQPDTARKP